MKLTDETFTEANKISETRFTWEKFCGKAHVANTDIFTTSGRLCPRWELVGWTPSKNLVIRPRTEGVAILVRCKDNDNEFYEGLEVWCHFESKAFNETLLCPSSPSYVTSSPLWRKWMAGA
jgi:hypothetical protein